MGVISHSGNLDTIVNITTPASVVTNDQVNRIIAKGCNIMKMPSAMTMQAAISSGFLRNHFGHLDRGYAQYP